MSQSPEQGTAQEKAKPMATLARLTSQTVKFVYHQDQEFAPHKEHVYPMSLQQARNSWGLSIE